VGKAEQLLVHTRNSLAIDAPYIFSLIDVHKLGYFTARTLSEWLAGSVGFRLNDFETKLLFNRYDREGRYSVGLREF
jgi:Ca2+-binding EF-hand superfamily protein